MSGPNRPGLNGLAPSPTADQGLGRLPWPSATRLLLLRIREMPH